MNCSIGANNLFAKGTNECNALQLLLAAPALMPASVHSGSCSKEVNIVNDDFVFVEFTKKNPKKSKANISKS